MSSPVVVAQVHIGHCPTRDEDEIREAQVTSHMAGVDGTSEDSLGDSGELGLLLGDLGPSCLVGPEDRVPERGVALRSLQVAAQQRLERRAGICALVSSASQVGHRHKSSLDDRGE